VNMTISLAFLAPDLLKAAIDGRLPHGMGVARLADLPAEWSRQHQMLAFVSRLGTWQTHPAAALPDAALEVDGPCDWAGRRGEPDCQQPAPITSDYGRS
jgi:hypothetical protein